MGDQKLDSFPPEVRKQLKYYVYRLIDPRNGETFYVGKGKDDRVFAHARAESSLDGDDVDNKTQRIREIKLAGLDVNHVIHRHGMDESTAIDVEAALIDAYPGLTNIVTGFGSNDYGVMHSQEIVARYAAEEAVFMHKALLINVNKSVIEKDLYQATRFAWRLNKDKAEEAEVILPVQQALIVGAFIADEWIEATADNFPGREDVPGRFGFKGHYAQDSIRNQYVHKRVPDKYRKRGASNPIRYTWE